MDEKGISLGGGDGNELEGNKKKREKEAKKAPKGGVQSLNASPRRGFSPRFGPPPEAAKNKKKGKKADGDGDGGENIEGETGGSRVRDRSKSLDYSAMSEISSRLQNEKKEKKENKKNKKKGATSASIPNPTPATREGRSATAWEAPAPSKLNSSKSKRSSSVRNALTCFIPSSKESPATDETIIDKKKVGDMIILAAEAEDDGGGSGKRKKKKAGKGGSTSSSSSSSSSLSLPASPTRGPPIHHHRLSGGMAFGDDQRGTTKKHRRNLSALGDLQYNNVVVVANGTAAAIPTSSSSPTLDSRPSKKNTLSPHMRSSSDRFSYNSKHNKEKLKTTKGSGGGGGGRPNQRNSNELADRRSSGLAKESRTGNRHRSSSSSSSSSSTSSSSLSSSGSGDEGSGHKKKRKEKKKKEKEKKKKDKQRQQQQHQLGSPNSRVMAASMTWRAKKTSQSEQALERPDLDSAAGNAPGHGTQIIISPRKPAPAFPKSKQRLSFSGWLTHFNVQLNPGAAENGPKRKYKEGTVEGFLEDLQLDEHVNELVKVRGIASMERLFEVTTPQFYDMDIPTSDLRLLIEEINKRKNPPPPPAAEPPAPEGDKPATPRQKTPRAHNNSAAQQPDTTAAGGEEAAATETKRKRRSTRSEKRRLEKEADDAAAAAALQALEQRLGEEAERRVRAEQEKDEALRALEAERQRAGDMEGKLAEALARIQALEQSLAAAQAATAESTKKKTKTKTKAKKAKKETRRKTPRAADADGATQDPSASESVVKGEHDDVSKAKEATATTASRSPCETTEKAHGEGDGETPETPAEGEGGDEGEGEGEGLIQYHYPLPIRVPSGRVNRLSTRLSLKAKSPASPRGASPRTVLNTNSSEARHRGRMRQAEKETFEQKQNDIRHWIEEATKESFPSADFFKSLRSGVLLCKLLNVISPGLVKEVHVGDMVFYQMENITYFVQGCRKLGVKTVFEPADLYHGKNLEAVLSCLDALDRWSRRSTTYKGPFLVRSTSHSQFIRSLSGKLMLDKDVISKKDSSGDLRPLTPAVAAAHPN